MEKKDYTQMGGAGAVFLTTHWSLIEAAGSEEKDPDRSLIGLLMEQYWRPVYCYLRRKGYDNEQAKDLTQGFFHEMVLGHRLIEKADAAKGRFRTYLLTALNRYVVNVHNAETARKRIPKEKLVPLDHVGSANLPEPLAAASPEDSFAYAWVSGLLERTLEEVEAKCHQDGLSSHWHLFHDRVLEPILSRSEAPPLADLCRKYGLAEPGTASNMIVTIKRRFRDTFHRYLRAASLSEDGTQEELLELQRFFPEIAQDVK